MAESLYIHIPFCMRKCRYCDFLSVPFDAALAVRYTNALCRELEMRNRLSDGLKTIFIGGGTPSVLPPECLEQIFACIRESYRILPAAEISVEANPGAITAGKIDTLLSLGVNRLSLGVQSLLDPELRTLGRIHTAQEAMRSAEMICAAGMENLSIDLIYGIPGQTIDTWEYSLTTAVLKQPKHISAYELTPEKGTEFREMLTDGTLSMPSEDTILEMHALAIKYLSASGYEHYEISNHARPGYRCMHNLNYWNRGEYIGAGAGAHSFIRGFRSKNSEGITEYIRRLDEQTSPEVESVEIPCEDALKEFVFLGLRKTEGIRLFDADERGLDMPAAARELMQEGFAEISAGNFRLTAKGLPVSNTLIVKLLQNLGL